MSNRYSIVMTGGSSGLGLHAAKRIARAGHDLCLAVRGAAPKGVKAHVVSTDLGRLDDVRAFADTIIARQGGQASTH